MKAMLVYSAHCVGHRAERHLFPFQMSMDADISFNSTASKSRTRRKPIEEMSADDRQLADQIDLKCLSICIGVFERLDDVGACMTPMRPLITLIMVLDNG
jgi:hypothetical protein